MLPSKNPAVQYAASAGREKNLERKSQFLHFTSTFTLLLPVSYLLGGTVGEDLVN